MQIGEGRLGNFEEDEARRTGVREEAGHAGADEAAGAGDEDGLTGEAGNRGGFRGMRGAPEDCGPEGGRRGGRSGHFAEIIMALPLCM